MPSEPNPQRWLCACLLLSVPSSHSIHLGFCRQEGLSKLEKHNTEEHFEKCNDRKEVRRTHIVCERAYSPRRRSFKIETKDVFPRSQDEDDNYWYWDEQEKEQSFGKLKSCKTKQKFPFLDNQAAKYFSEGLPPDENGPSCDEYAQSAGDKHSRCFNFAFTACFVEIL